ncbi:subfamily M23B non-peptidase homologue (M23 family) [Schistosoma mansoni]|uniref:subfamily M23B non-peptidase homologue (M23 family) n=1 Tax=Schistosoma mansoni TaxID=6183 RepID=UPI0001A63884|nr:subfamily M23B non-peptidase homologue (M23 family) [Schistosoma mansoni]|eukprot:XP_018654552.1 subfamily M23B non-peptidase homologue (M23 family) [Schistosoma mansoni]
MYQETPRVTNTEICVDQKKRMEWMNSNVLRQLPARSISESVHKEGYSGRSNKIRGSFSRKQINSPDKRYTRNSAMCNTNRDFAKNSNCPVSNFNDDYLDEILILRKKVALLSKQNKDINAQCRILKENPVKTENGLTMLVNPIESSKINQNAGCCKQNSPENIRLLHQKFFKLQNQLQDKDSQYNRLVTDMKFTRVEELRVQLETAFAEIKRLKEQNHILSDQCSEKKGQSTSKPKKRFSSEKNQSNFQIKTLSRVIKDLDQQKQELIAKNHCLVNKIQKLYRHLSSNDVKEDITPYRACQDDECNVQNVTNQVPKVSTIVQRDENMVSELASAKAQIANLLHLNKTLSESSEKMKKDYEIMKKIRKGNRNDEKLENGGVFVKMETTEKDVVKQIKNILPTKDLHYEDDENTFNHRNEKNQSEMKNIQEQNRFNGQSDLGYPFLLAEADGKLKFVKIKEKYCSLEALKRNCRMNTSMYTSIAGVEEKFLFIIILKKEVNFHKSEDN